MGIAIRFGNCMLSLQVWYWDPTMLKSYILHLSFQSIGDYYRALRLVEIGEGKKRSSFEL